MEVEMRLLGRIVIFLLMVFSWVLPGWYGQAIAAETKPMAQPMAQQIENMLQIRSCVGCNLQGADLQNLDLRGINLTRANLKGANLSKAQMMAVVLKDADLRGANLDGADLLVVDMTGANLKGASAKKVDLQNVRLCHTTSPQGKLSNRDC
jgi:hypothetical protein